MDRESPVKWFINLAVFLLALLACFGLLAMAFSRDHFEELSAVVAGEDALLMGSRFADLVMRLETALLLGVAIAVLAAKEFFLRRLTTRLVLNATALLVGLGVAAATLHGVYLAPLD